MGAHVPHATALAMAKANAGVVELCAKHPFCVPLGLLLPQSSLALGEPAAFIIIRFQDKVNLARSPASG